MSAERVSQTLAEERISQQEAVSTFAKRIVAPAQTLFQTCSELKLVRQSNPIFGGVTVEVTPGTLMPTGIEIEHSGDKRRTGNVIIQKYYSTPPSPGKELNFKIVHLCVPPPFKDSPEAFPVKELFIETGLRKQKRKWLLDSEKGLMIKIHQDNENLDSEESITIIRDYIKTISHIETWEQSAGTEIELWSWGFSPQVRITLKGNPKIIVNYFFGKDPLSPEAKTLKCETFLDLEEGQSQEQILNALAILQDSSLRQRLNYFKHEINVLALMEEVVGRIESELISTEKEIRTLFPPQT